MVKKLFDIGNKIQLNMLHELEKKIGYKFKEQEFLNKALSHKSSTIKASNNELFEFLGDSLLNVVITIKLFNLYVKNITEGQLTRLRAKLVCENTLAEIAASLELESFIIIGKGEKKAGGNRRPSILADAMEAIFAAIYLDSGKDFDLLYKIICDLFGNKFNEEFLTDVKDSKTLLQEYCQANSMNLPVYTLINTSGPEHKLQFTVKATLKELECVAIASSRKQAEQLCALKLLKVLNSER